MSEVTIKVKPQAKPSPAKKTQEKKSLAEQIRAALEAEGFAVEHDPEVGLSFRFEGGTYYLPPSPDDAEFYHVLYPNFWALESEEEYGRALLACDAVNRGAKLVKLHTAEADVWVGVEALHPSPEAFLAQLPRYLNYLQDAVRAFRDEMLAGASGGDDHAEA